MGSQNIDSRPLEVKVNESSKQTNCFFEFWTKSNLGSIAGEPGSFLTTRPDEYREQGEAANRCKKCWVGREKEWRKWRINEWWGEEKGKPGGRRRDSIPVNVKVKLQLPVFTTYAFSLQYQYYWCWERGWKHMFHCLNKVKSSNVFRLIFHFWNPSPKDPLNSIHHCQWKETRNCVPWL